jgi:hypothetical protein
LLRRSIVDPRRGAVQVNDTSLRDVTHEQAVAALKATKDTVRFTIAKPSDSLTEEPDGEFVHLFWRKIVVCVFFYHFKIRCLAFFFLLALLYH